MRRLIARVARALDAAFRARLSDMGDARVAEGARLHHAFQRRRPARQPVRGHADAVVDLRLARGVALDRDPAEQRHHVVRSGAGQAQLARARTSVAWPITARSSAMAADGRRFALGASGGRKILGAVLQTQLVPDGPRHEPGSRPSTSRASTSAATARSPPTASLPHPKSERAGAGVADVHGAAHGLSLCVCLPRRRVARRRAATWAAPRSCRRGATP